MPSACERHATLVQNGWTPTSGDYDNDGSASSSFSASRLARYYPASTPGSTSSSSVASGAFVCSATGVLHSFARRGGVRQRGGGSSREYQATSTGEAVAVASDGPLTLPGARSLQNSPQFASNGPAAGAATSGKPTLPAGSTYSGGASRFFVSKRVRMIV